MNEKDGRGGLRKERLPERNNALNGRENINRALRKSQGHMQMQSE